MKRLLVSVLCGFLIPFMYIVITGPLSLYTNNERINYYLLIPIGWPRILLYRYCFPNCPFDGDVIFPVILIASNVLLYATLTYFVLWLRSLRKPKTHAAPPPPNF